MAKREGVYQGGKLRLDRERVKEPSVNGLGPAAIARELGMARSSIYWLLEEAGQHANWAQPRGAASCGDYLKRNTLPGGSDCDRVMLEGRFPVATFEALGGLGHDAQAWPDFTFQCGAVCAVLHDSASGVKIAAADPRRNTGVAGR
jgi:hypothetical protein